MRRPPLFLHLRISGEKRRPGCWLPLFLLLPLALVLLIALSPVILVAALILRRRRRNNPKPGVSRIVLETLCSWRATWAFVDLICSTTGLKIDAQDKTDRVIISFV